MCKFSLLIYYLIVPRTTNRPTLKKIKYSHWQCDMIAWLLYRWMLYLWLWIICVVGLEWADSWEVWWHFSLPFLGSRCDLRDSCGWPSSHCQQPAPLHEGKGWEWVLGCTCWKGICKVGLTYVLGKLCKYLHFCFLYILLSLLDWCSWTKSQPLD